MPPSHSLPLSTPPADGPPRLAARIRQWARDVMALYFAARDTRVAWYAKALVLLVAGDALTPTDLIPDSIPVLGYLDDVILVPVGILRVRRLVPASIFAEHRSTAERVAARPTSRTAAAIIVAEWLAALVRTAFLLWPMVEPRRAVAGARAR